MVFIAGYLCNNDSGPEPLIIFVSSDSTFQCSEFFYNLNITNHEKINELCPYGPVAVCGILRGKNLR